MFEFLFKYPPAIFREGQVRAAVGMARLAAVAADRGGGAAVFSGTCGSGTALLTNARSIVIWLAQTALIALLLLMLWHPAISVARLRPQQNVVAVLVDHSRSMGIADDGKPRLQNAEDVLEQPAASRPEQDDSRSGCTNSDAMPCASIRRADLAADDNATRIGDSLKHIAAEAGTMPLGAIVVLSDGGDNTGGIDRETIAQLRQLRIPVHTVGFGPDHFAKDIEIVDVAAPARALAQSRLSARVAIRQHGYAGAKVKLMVRENDHPISEQEIALKPDAEQSETIVFNAGRGGRAQFPDRHRRRWRASRTRRTTAVVRLVNVTPKKMRILYMEGEPRWEYKFIRRAHRGRPEHRGGHHPAHHAEQDLSPGHRRFARTRRTDFPTKAGRAVQVRRSDYRQRGGELFQHRAAGA